MQNLFKMASLNSFKELITKSLNLNIFTFMRIGSIPFWFLNCCINFFRSWSRNSKIRISFLLVWITSSKVTMLGWLNSFKIDISLNAVLGIPSSSLYKLIFLTATIWLLVRSKWNNIYLYIWRLPHKYLLLMFPF